MGDISAYDKEGRRKYLNAVELEAFLRESQKLTPLETALCLTLYHTGCRISEVLELQCRSKDLRSNVLAIRTLKKRKKKEFRRIQIPEGLTKILVDQVSSSQAPIFPYSRTTAWRIIKAVMASAGITGIHACPKGLRHAYGVRAITNKIPLNTVSMWMGHSDLETTATYLDVRDAEERELASRMW